ncbi:putative 26S proteasome regulatory subunit 6b, partial [Toxoplasma gondii RUB]
RFETGEGVSSGYRGDLPGGWYAGGAEEPLRDFAEGFREGVEGTRSQARTRLRLLQLL